MTGVVDWKRDEPYAEIVLQVADMKILLQGEPLRGLPFGMGARVAAHGVLRVVGDYGGRRSSFPTCEGTG
ncbi:MAG: hypothetical protein ACR2JU_02370 [Nocardioidaceae bacterium]